MADHTAAVEYAGAGGWVLHCAVALRNPYQYHASFEHDLDFDSAAVGLIRGVFAESAAACLEASMLSDGLFGFEVQRAIAARGFDGLIATYPDRSWELVAFDPAQIVTVRREGLAPTLQRQDTLHRDDTATRA